MTIAYARLYYAEHMNRNLLIPRSTGYFSQPWYHQENHRDDLSGFAPTSRNIQNQLFPRPLFLFPLHRVS
jgi:hypothetical protein